MRRPARRRIGEPAAGPVRAHRKPGDGRGTVDVVMQHLFFL